MVIHLLKKIIKDIQLNLLSITGVTVNSQAGKAKVTTIGEEDYYLFPLKGTSDAQDKTADRAGEVSV